MQITLLAFAHAREHLGFAERVVECQPEESPRQILARIAPTLDVTTLRVAVALEYADWDAPIGAANEMALIPPVSGG
jgi:molybdopterin synthase sulfur carrier subunit